MQLTYRTGFKQNSYKVLNDEKLNSIKNNNITLKQALDLWWNSVRIGDNICYKCCHNEYPEYELDNLSLKYSLNKKIYIYAYSVDMDGYPICFAKFYKDRHVVDHYENDYKNDYKEI